MPAPKTIGSYADCKQLLDRALNAGGCRAKFPTEAAAIAFRARCYRFRSLVLKAAAEAALPGQPPSTPYDALFIQLEADPPALAFRIRQFEGEVEDLNEAPGSDPLLAEAVALKKRLTFE